MEIEVETAAREIYEEVVITIKSTGQVYNENDVKTRFVLANCPYVELYVDSKHYSNDRSRLIGLFIVHVDEKVLQIKSYDKTENPNYEWLKLHDILNKPQRKRDKYHTLRPIIEYLNRHVELSPQKNL